MPEPGNRIHGGGLAGCCLAWEYWERGADFQLNDRGSGGSSRIAAGMINPITGKNFEPSWRIADFLPSAIAFYRKIEARLGRQLWFPLPVLRLAGTDKEWRKIASKLDSPWVAGIADPPPGWAGAVEVRGGGRLDVRGFVEGSQEFFGRAGRFERGEFPQDFPAVRCDGAAGLMTGIYGPHRCAKGEILTLRAAAWAESHIRIGAGGWLVPLGGGLFKAGSTYEWNELDDLPTEAGRIRVAEIAARLGGGGDFEIVAHDAGIRPILRRSQPLIGPMPDGGWMFNALGSKGSLYAPGMAARLADWILDGREPEAEVDFREFQKIDSTADGRDGRR